MRVVWSLLQNPHIHIEPYLHQLMPSVVTCLVGKRLGSRFADNHWELRDFTANLVASICKRFAHVYNSLQTRLTKTLGSAFTDTKRAITQHYGAIQGLAALGPNVVRLLILPNLEEYLKLLEPEMLLEKQKNEMKRHEAWRVYGALLRAAGYCIYDRLKMFPPLPCPPAHTVWRTNRRVITTSPTNKRKASMEDLEQQPPLKRVETDGPMLVEPNHSLPSDPPGEIGASNAVPSSTSRQDANESVRGGRGRREMGDKNKASLRMSAVLNQVWKEDLKSGHLLVSLFELFGDRIFSFIPTPEMSLFL